MHDARLHVAAIDVAAPADTVFAFLADPHRLASWAHGLAEQRVVGTDHVVGRLAADGSPIHCRIVAAPALRVVSFRLGEHPDRTVPRIQAQVIDGELFGCSGCRLELLAWRTADMDDARWVSLRDAHEAEVREIGCLVESGSG